MKKLFFATALVALACAGCATEEESVAPASGKYPVNFSTSIAEVTRTAPVEGVQFGAGAQIGVFGTEKLVEAATANWMDNVCLTRAENATWSYDNTRYMLPGYSYSFVAYAPYKSVAPIMTDLTAVPYSVPANIADQEDFMYANTITKDFSAKAPTASDNVVFAFNHALAQVKFSALMSKDYSAYYTVKITKVALADIASEGTLNFADGTWKGLATLIPYEETMADLALTASTQALTSSTNGGKDVLMLIPQDPGSKKLTLTVSIKAITDKGDAALDKDNYSIEVAIPAGHPWLAGHVYDYKITLNLDSTLGAGIADPTITEWGTPEVIPVPAA